MGDELKNVHEYTEANLRAASPEKCQHWVGGELVQERSYGRMYFWYVCPLCQGKFGYGTYQDY